MSDSITYRTVELYCPDAGKLATPTRPATRSA